MSNPSNKKRPRTTTAAASDLSLLHQSTALHFGYNGNNNNSNNNNFQQQWNVCYGQSTLYVVSTATTTSPTEPPQEELALHLRGCCVVDSVTVETVVEQQQPQQHPPEASSSTTNKNNSCLLLSVVPTVFYHVDPLEHVLVGRGGNNSYYYSKNNNENQQEEEENYKLDADAQCTRGAAGMTTGLRAASMASNLGELRIIVTLLEEKTTTTATAASSDTAAAVVDAATQIWKTDLEQTTTMRDGGAVHQRLQTLLQERAGEQHRNTRLEAIATRLGQAASSSFHHGGGSSNKDDPKNNNNNVGIASNNNHRAFKVTVRYHIPAVAVPSTVAGVVKHLAGLHYCCGRNDDSDSAAATTPPPPHVYTTTGVYGDHEGPRSWIPCLDSAAVHHRASHCLSITVTAPVTEGLSVVGCGEDYGVSETLLHEKMKRPTDATDAALQQQVGDDHFNWIIRQQQQQEQQKMVDGGPNIILPDDDDDDPQQQQQVTLDMILATVVWCSHTWSPIPCRSLGFAIGPFKVLEDPEYFGPSSVPDDDEDMNDDAENGSESFEDRLAAFLEGARRNGEGIRQVYFAPLFERKYIHTTGPNVNMSLLPNTTLRILPLTNQQKEMANQLDRAVYSVTTGVPHRALSLMRDVLALPTYRTVSYTQIWIPNAVHGGATSGALHNCPEVLVNPFLGGCIMDSRLLPPVGSRLPFYQGGRALQFLQARNAVRGWITAALPIGGHDDVGTGYLFALIESFIMSLYERGHGGQGEGGAKGSVLFSKRYSLNSGLNSANLDFLPVQNIEEIDEVIGVGAVPVEDRHNEQLWRGANNGSESHTSGMDEFNARQLLCKDGVDALERETDKDKIVPSPSMGWFGSHLSLSFLSSNATSSSDLGCGAVELLHPVGGLVYRAMKSDVFRGVVEGRAGVANFIRLVRAAFIAAHLSDVGEKELRLPKRKKKSDKAAQSNDAKTHTEPSKEDSVAPKQPFVICVNEILKKKGLTHTLFTRALQNLSGRIKEPQLAGTLVDVERMAVDPRTRHPFVDPEGFPNSYVRGASLLLCRVGVQVEAARDSSSQSQTKGIQMQAYAEPVIPEGGIAYGGPITVRVVENEGSFREYVKDLAADGSRRDWGATFLHAKPVTTAKAQTAASGAIESKGSAKTQQAKASMLEAPATTSAFTESNFHSGGYQAIELIRLTNLTPLLWVRVDPMGLYGGRISVYQPDACLAEQLFHDGDSGAQIDAMRALAERPLRIQGSVKVTTVYDVNVSELPVRILGDCFRGSPALHSSLPHTPTVRAQAALAIAQWQNNKAPASKDMVGADNWVGLNILLQYFKERFYSNSVVMPNKFSRLVLKKSESDVRQAAAAADGVTASAQPSYDDTYQYLDTLDDEERKVALKNAEEIEMEEDEEYRVRSAAVTAIACIRAKDGETPPLAIQLLEAVLEAEDAEMVGNVVLADKDLLLQETFRKMKARASEILETESDKEARSVSSLTYVSSMLVADSLLALCHVNAMPAVITDPATGKKVQSLAAHPLRRLMKAARSWLEWELYRENIRLEFAEKTQSGVSGNCNDAIAACAIIALSNLAILKQSTTDKEVSSSSDEMEASPKKDRSVEDVSTAKFYIDIFDSRPVRNDLTRAACAQAIACICCAADRFEKPDVQPVGLLTALEFLLNRINDERTSLNLRHTLALLMMDACTGKVCSMQRVGAIAGRNDLITSLARFYNGPLGACHGGDNGSAILTTVSPTSFPAANAVNDGARRGMRLLSRAGRRNEDSINKETVVRVARFATRLWRTINGEPAVPPTECKRGEKAMGVCAYDGILRCTLLALWQWIWPKACVAVLAVQDWKSLEGTKLYRDMGAHLVMKVSDKEKDAAEAEENSVSEIYRLVDIELDRQRWRGEMAGKAYDLYMASKGHKPTQDIAATEQGIGQPLPPIVRDPAFKQGGWIASAAQQRRAKSLDGGTNVTKIRLTVKSSDIS